MRLLTIGNPKLDKGRKKGFLPAGLHLAPAGLAGTFSVARADGTMREITVNVCPSSTWACRQACLNTAGRGGLGLDADGMNTIQAARIRRTRRFFTERAAFMLDLEHDITLVVRQARRKRLRPVIRLNVLSDLRWETVGFTGADGRRYANLFERFPRVTFYDYTKVPNRRLDGIANYSVTFSLSEDNRADAERQLERGVNVAVVLRDPRRPGSRKALELPTTWRGRPVVDGDETDLRFLDPVGVYVALRAKGRAIHDTTGFVHDLDV